MDWVDQFQVVAKAGAKTRRKVSEMADEKRKINNVQAIREFFAKDGGREVSLAEMKELTREDRVELGALAAKELGVEIAVQ